MIDNNIMNRESPNYIGLTRSSIHARMNAHLEGQRRHMSSNPLYRHDVHCHDGVKQVYTWKPIAAKKKIVRLYMNKALQIKKFQFFSSSSCQLQ